MKRYECYALLMSTRKITSHAGILQAGGNKGNMRTCFRVLSRQTAVVGDEGCRGSRRYECYDSSMTKKYEGNTKEYEEICKNYEENMKNYEGNMMKYEEL